MNDMLEKNRELKIKLLKSLTFDVLENESSISVIMNEESHKTLKEIKSFEPDWDENLFIDSVVRNALEEAVKEVTDLSNENKS